MADPAADEPVRAVNPVIQSEAQAVDARLIVLRRETCEQFRHHIGLAVAVGVLGVDDVRRGADEHTLAPRRDAGGEGKALEENGRLVVFAVAVQVFQKFYAPARPVAADVRRRRPAFPPPCLGGYRRFWQAHRVIAHFDDP